MGETAENVAERYSVSRADQDAFALESHRRAIAAADAGRFDDEIVSIDVAQPKGEPVTVHADEGPRPDTSLEKLARLRPIFRDGGSVTAGNSSQINDGAACVVLTSEERARELDREPLARIVSSGAAGVDPGLMGVGPVPAVRKALDGAGLSVGDIDLVELNEAFAAQVLASMRELGFEHERLNVNGGAIALGPPAGLLGRAAAGHARLGAAPPRRALRGGHDVHRRGPGPGRGDRESGCVGSTPHDRFRTHRRTAAHPRNGPRFRRRRDTPARARERPQRAFRHRARPEDRRYGLSRGDRARGVRRPRRGLPHLRPDRGGGRARLFGHANGRERGDLAGVFLARALGLGGAEAGVAATAVLGRGPRLLRADRARYGLRRGQPEDARQAGGRQMAHQRGQDVDLARATTPSWP